MQRFERLSQLKVNKPCAADWDAMTGDEARRFCGGCQKHVHNLSEMAAEDAEALIQSGPVCVRYRADSRGRIITRTALIASAAILAGACAPPEDQPLTGRTMAPESKQVMGEIAKPGPDVTMGMVPMPVETMGEISAPDQNGDAQAKKKAKT